MLVCTGTSSALFDVPVRETRERARERDARFHPGERGTEAEVRAVPEGGVPLDLASHEEPIGVDELARITVRAAVEQQDLRPRRDLDAVRRYGRSVQRPFTGDGAS